MMQVELRIRNTDLTNTLRSYAERRLRFALSRFGDRTGRVVVTVSELESPDQGIATNCHISAEIRPFGQVAARETDPDLYAAIDRAAGRLGRLFASRLGREKDEVQRPEFTADCTKRTRRKKVSSKPPRLLLRKQPQRRLWANLDRQRGCAARLRAEQTNKRRG